MVERVFGPYYGTPPETRLGGPTRTEQAFQQPAATRRKGLRQRLLAARGPRTRRPRDRT
jgi:hypothetical protein